MRRTLCIVVALLVIAAALPAMAGGKDHKKCCADPAECLAKMKAKYAEKPWLGIEMDVAKDGTHTITRVVPGSPAEAAGFKNGDVLMAMNGVKYVKSDELKAVWSDIEPGSKAVYIVLRDGEKRKIKAKLGHVSTQQAKMWIDEHMKKFHSET